MSKHNLNMSLIAIIFLAVVILGCINSNEPAQKTQSISPTPTLTNETKDINLRAQQIILNDTEIKEVLGYEWEKKDQKEQTENDSISSSISLKYANSKKTDNASNEVIITILVSPTILAANNSYQTFEPNVSEDVKITKNEIEIGDTGKLYSVVNAKNGDKALYLMFRRNNIIFFLSYRDEANVETVLELGRKQDKKILTFLT